MNSALRMLTFGQQSQLSATFI